MGSKLSLGKGDKARRAGPEAPLKTPEGALDVD